MKRQGIRLAFCFLMFVVVFASTAAQAQQYYGSFFSGGFGLLSERVNVLVNGAGMPGNAPGWRNFNFSVASSGQEIYWFEGRHVTGGNLQVREDIYALSVTLPVPNAPVFLAVNSDCANNWSLTEPLPGGVVFLPPGWDGYVAQVEFRDGGHSRFDGVGDVYIGSDAVIHVLRVPRAQPRNITLTPDGILTVRNVRDYINPEGLPYYDSLPVGSKYVVFTGDFDDMTGFHVIPVGIDGSAVVNLKQYRGFCTDSNRVNLSVDTTPSVDRNERLLGLRPLNPQRFTPEERALVYHITAPQSPYGAGDEMMAVNLNPDGTFSWVAQNVPVYWQPPCCLQ